MSYRIQIFLTHCVTGAAAGCACWFASGSAPIMTIAMIILGVLAPTALAITWFTRGIVDTEAALMSTGPGANRPGLLELDQMVGRLQGEFQRERVVRQDVERLVVQLNGTNRHEPNSGIEADRLLSATLAALARTAAKDVGRILSFGEDISRGAHDTHHNADEQAQTVARTISSVERLAGNIDLVSQNAEAGSEAAIQVRESAAKGQVLVQELITGMQHIRISVGMGERKVMALGDRSQEISSIVETMGAISARTDLLALNASIEAVRAGQEGKGFAVVAEEVRRLAESTANASGEIANLVKSIQHETQDTMSTMADQQSQVEQEVERVNAAGVALEHISQTSADSAELVARISQATLDQLRGTQEVVVAMQQVSEFAERIQDRADGIRRTTTELAGAARDLEDGLSPMYHCDQGARPILSSPDPVRNSPQMMFEGSHDSPGSELVAAVQNQEFGQ